VSDLTSELQAMADNAAHQARPLAAADVIRRGDRRRRRTIAQQSLGGLSVAGVAAVAIFAGVAGGVPVAPASSSGASPAGHTLAETTSSRAGAMTISAKYLYEPHGRIKLLSVTYSGDAQVAVRKPSLLFEFGSGNPQGAPPATNRQQRQSTNLRGLPVIIFFFVNLRPAALHDFTGSLAAREIALLNKTGDLSGGETLSVTLSSGAKPTAPTGNQVSLRPVMQDDFVLTTGSR
jgi:hypothetical protein